LPDSNPIPKRLLQARTAFGISQRKLGIQIGMEPSSASSRMNHYEKGRHTPDYQTLKRLADELNVPVTFFFCESGKVADLLCLINKLSETDTDLLTRYASNLLENNKASTPIVSTTSEN